MSGKAPPGVLGQAGMSAHLRRFQKEMFKFVRGKKRKEMYIKKIRQDKTRRCKVAVEEDGD
jgi:hypothetical protein